MSRIYEALLKEMQGTAPSRIENSGKSAFLETNPGDENARRARAFATGVENLGVAPGSVPLRLDVLRERCAKVRWKLRQDYTVLFNTESFNMCAEKFRSLRACLNRLRAKNRLRTLLVTSSVAGEGKSFVSLNLARVIARQQERNVLLIDADLRAPKLHVTLGAPSAPGLSDYLRGQADEFSIIQIGATENLAFIPAGGPVSNCAELLSNKLAKGLLEKLSPAFEWVIVDAPPILLASDASLLAAICDGTILVVGAGTTASNLAQTACQELRDSNLLGVVLNGAEDGSYSGYGYYGAPKNKSWLGS
jgi:capsular exopolysaccharide synthesis family protein